MFVDWPEHRARLEKQIEEALRERIRLRAPLTESVRHVTIDEGEKIVFEYPNGEVSEIVPQEHTARVEYPREKRAAGPGYLAEAMDDLAQQVADEMEHGMVETIGESINSDRGTASAFRGEDSSELAESLLEAVRSTDMTFDEEGKPTIAFIGSPGGAERMLALNDSEDLQRRFDEIIDDKRREWNRREDRRRLVD